MTINKCVDSKHENKRKEILVKYSQITGKLKNIYLHIDEKSVGIMVFFLNFPT